MKEWKKKSLTSPSKLHEMNLNMIFILKYDTRMAQYSRYRLQFQNYRYWMINKQYNYDIV